MFKPKVCCGDSALRQNKWEEVPERQLDIVFDHLHTLNDLTPKVKASKTTGVDLSLLFGLDSRVFREPIPLAVPDHDREVETYTILKGAKWPVCPPCGSDVNCEGGRHDNPNNDVESSEVDDATGLDRSHLLDVLGSLSKESIWRVKGFVRLLPNNQVYILNWAFGRYELDLCSTQDVFPTVQLTVMGRRGEMKRLVHRFAERLGGIVHT